MPAPEQLSVEVFDQVLNAWIVRTPGRHFPGVVVQGDSLHGLYALAESVHWRARSVAGADPELAGEAQELRDLLWGRLRAYEDALRAHGLPLPYDRHAYPGNSPGRRLTVRCSGRGTRGWVNTPAGCVAGWLHLAPTAAPLS